MTSILLFKSILNIYIYIYIYLWSWIQVTLGITLSNITSSNNLSLNSYFKNSAVELHVLYFLSMHTNIHVNQLLFTIQTIYSYFMHYFKLQKFEFKQLIDNMTIDI